MAMVVVEDSCLQANSQPESRGLVWGVDGCLALFYIHQMNRVNYRNDLVVMMTALYTLSWVLLLLLCCAITTYIFYIKRFTPAVWHHKLTVNFLTLHKSSFSCGRNCQYKSGWVCDNYVWYSSIKNSLFKKFCKTWLLIIDSINLHAAHIKLIGV